MNATLDDADAELTRLGLPGLSSSGRARALTRPAADELPAAGATALTEVVAAVADAVGNSLIQTPVRIIASDRWVLLAFWSAKQTSTPSVTTEGLYLAQIAAGSASSGAADLALEVLLQAARSSERSSRLLSHRLAETSDSDEEQLSSLAEAFDALDRMVADVRRPGDDPTTAWFVERDGRNRAQRVAEVLDVTARRARSSSREVRRKAETGRAVLARRTAEVNQLVLGTLAAILLGPSLVAGVLDAFPGWLPQPRRDDVMICLSIASAGLIWLLVTGLPLVAARRGPSPWRWFGLAVGTAMVLGGVLASLPLNTGSDEQPPQVTATCPGRPVRVGDIAVAAVAARDPEGNLATPSSVDRELDTASPGVLIFTASAEDRFGNAGLATCAYRVVRGRPAP